MRTGQLQLLERRAVGPQFVGYQQFRHKSLLPKKLAHQAQRRPAVAATLDQHVEDLALVVDGSPQVHPLAGDPNDHLVQMPSIAQARSRAAAVDGASRLAQHRRNRWFA